MRRGRPKHPDILTPREWEVLALLREGLTNPQIAERLGISENGAKYHVLEILSKLGVSSRYEAAAWQREPEPVGRRFAGLAALFALRPPKLGSVTASKLAMGALAVAAFGFLGLLAAGVLIMEGRASGKRPAPAATPQAVATPVPSPAPSQASRINDRAPRRIPIGPEGLTELPAGALVALAEFASSEGTSYAGLCASSTTPGQLCHTAFDGAMNIQHTGILVQMQVFGELQAYFVLLAPEGPDAYRIERVTGPHFSRVPPHLLD